MVFLVCISTFVQSVTVMVPELNWQPQLQGTLYRGRLPGAALLCCPQPGRSRVPVPRAPASWGVTVHLGKCSQ